MSRIHEALKRAEAEKASGHNGGRDEELSELHVATQVTEPVEIEAANRLDSNAISPARTTEPAAELLRFEDLWANCQKTAWKLDPSILVFSNTDPFKRGTEQFRTLRSRLYRIRESQPLQTVLISSAIPAEGKTVVATNLAYAIARQQGCRVLLVDADLRSPRIHTILGAPLAPGLGDYLQGGISEFDVIQRGNEDGLCFIPAGNHVAHPSELISSKRMKMFLDRVKPAFDWIIVDSPPALPVADASVLASLCDGMLFVVRAGSTPSEPARKACAELKGANILGVVLNTVSHVPAYGGYYGYSQASKDLEKTSGR